MSEPLLKSQSGGTGWLLSGTVSLETVTPLLAAGRRCIDEATDSEVHIDLSEISESDSAAVALLVDWFRYAAHKQKQLVLEKMPSKMQDVVKVSGLDKVFIIK